jgi:uncharacterized protein YgiM (DUF1202 family)
MDFLISLIIASFLAIIPAKIAESKGRSFGKWWIYGFLLWMIALPHALLISKPKVNDSLDISAVNGNGLYRVNTSTLNVRKGPDLISEYIFKLNYNETVDIIEMGEKISDNNAWCLIRDKQKREGWCYSDNLDKIL